MSRQRSALEVGSIHRGVVARIESFGAFVNIAGAGNDRGTRALRLIILPAANPMLPTRSYSSCAGLVHISQLAKDRVESVRDVLEENEEIYVKVLSVDVDAEGRQKISLSMKYCGQVRRWQASMSCPPCLDAVFCATGRRQRQRPSHDRVRGVDAQPTDQVLRRYVCTIAPVTYLCVATTDLFVHRSETT